MANTIFKYRLDGTGYNNIELPIGARIVHFALQDHYFTIWAEVQEGNECLPTTVHVIGTGWTLPNLSEFKYFQTTIEAGFVWHLYIPIGM